jgi:lysophospholipase L1-like esterase
VARIGARPRVYVWLAVAAILLIATAVVDSVGASSPTDSRKPGLIAAGLGLPSAHRARVRWIASWNASPQPPTFRVPFANGFEDQTVRNIVFTSAAGSLVRVRFSNAYGRQPLDIGRAVLGKAQHGAATPSRSSERLTFAGRRSVLIPAGGSVYSDPVRLRVRRFERLAISVFIPRGTGPPTNHLTAKQTNYVAPGDQALAASSAPFRFRTRSWYFVSGLDVRSPSPRAGTLVAFGDSITDGVGSRVNDDARWPNDLARRIDAVRGAKLSVVDAGIAGNQLLSGTRCCGESGLARFGRDVLSVPSVTEVIVLEGVNDIGAGNVSAARIIAGYRRLISLAHAARIKIFGATLTPFKGAGYWTPSGEAKRELVNAWIRHSGAFDGVIDFARAVADPEDPQMLDPAFNSGDHLHPNDAGYRAMANAINLKMVLPRH